MSSMVGPAVLYLAYALCFLVFNILMGRDLSSEMYSATIRRFIDTPFRKKPDKVLADVNSGPQVYEWITSVFLPQLYREYPMALDRQTYCSESSLCLLGEGDVDSDTHCAGSLVAGDNNCPSFLGSNAACCEACAGPSCSDFTVATESGDLTNTTHVSDVSQNCADHIPSWLHDLSQWSRPGSSRRLQSNSAEDPDFVYCPERLSHVVSDIDTRTAQIGHTLMLAEYNRVLMGRLTLKRANIVPHKSKAFANAYASMLSSTRTNAHGYSSIHENTDSFGNPEAKWYTYMHDKGFNQAGGFVEYIDFDSSQDHVLDHIATLKRHHWFDLNQGSLALELMMYNGNIDNFLYVSFVFEHDFSGRTHVSVNASPLDLSWHDLSRPASWVRFFIYTSVLIMFCFFVKAEFEDMSADWVSYFSDLMAMVHAASLALCAYCLVIHLTIFVSYTYLHFQFPMSTDKTARQQEFEDLASLAVRMDNFVTILSVNTLLICVRLISVITTLVPQAGIVINTMLQVGYSLIAFCVMFAIMSVGFTFVGYFCFGMRTEGFSTIAHSAISTTKMLMHDPNYLLLREGDSDAGFVFFVVFHISFLLVQQIALSILMLGYFKERGRVEQLQDVDKYPLKRLWRMFVARVPEYSSWINRCAVSLQRLLFGSHGGGTSRVNYEKVAKLRDRRATKPRMRNVLYEQKQDDEAEETDIVSKDVKLRAVQPFYPGGMMHYYVESVTQNGPAHDFRVQPGFRLVETQHQGTVDRERFRQIEVFESAKDPQKILRELSRLPVTLVFEGRVKPVSWECLGLMSFIILFFSFVMMVSRVGDSYHQHMIHERALVTPQWHTYNPRHKLSFKTMESMDDVSSWVSTAIVDNEYGCLSDADSGTSCGAAGTNGDARGDWFLWHGIGVDDALPASMVDDNEVQPLSYHPPAAHGLSVGYVPLTPPATSRGSEFICATENANQESNCPECTMGTTCICAGKVKYGYGANWTDWIESSGSIQCSTDIFGEPFLGQGKVCICRQAQVRVTQSVQMHDYNVGVMANNHVRLTFQVACFQPNSEPRWAGGYPWRLETLAAQSQSCADEPCMQKLQESDISCWSAKGENRSKSTLRGGWSNIDYEFTLDGTYKYLGGFSVGFGNTRQEAAVVSDILGHDQIFEQHAISAVFEVVTYNGNFDMFMYSEVGFSLKSTGKLEKSMRTSAFPLNIFTIINWLCFAAYIASAVIFTLHFLYDLHNQYNISNALLRPPYMFMIDFFKDDWWNIVDIGSVILNILVIQSLCSFMLINSRTDIRQGTKTWTGEYEFNAYADLNTVDQIQEFETAASLYQRFSGVAALNGLLLIVRFMKYFGGIAALRLVMTTLSAAIQELIFIIIIVFVVFFGFVFLFQANFGIQFEGLGEIYQTLVSTFLFVLGKFQIGELFRQSPVFWVFVLPAFQVSSFLLLNMLLAAIVFSWKDTRRDAQEFSLHSAWHTLRESLAWYPQGMKDEKEEVNLKKLDADFWQKLSILRYVNTLDESGKMIVSRSEHQRSRRKLDSGEDPDRGEDPKAEHSESEHEEVGTRYNFEIWEDQKKFLKAFKKAHMELASRMCRAMDAPKRDQGGGVGDLDEEFRTNDPVVGSELVKKQQDDDGGFIGIVEDAQPDDKVKFITCALSRKLEEADHLSEEIWLDALLTVLEEAQGLDKLQRFFLPMPMILPRKPQEWGVFNQRKVKMERRLDMFLKWLQEEARVRHYAFLQEMAESKERVLKQQSLVLTDYLETLDNQIQKIQNDIQELERKNAQMRSPFAPQL
mmetsp:Transcript_133030/g.331995  ORF Transcript_133030/g.331995 Transcript_133030/m.331995 type:complete len:1777 (-) Transcript_133030:96-5426(-)